MTSPRLTLPDLLRFDPDSRPAIGTTRQRFLCPLCGVAKPRDVAHRSFDLDLRLDVYVCHRCGARGKLGRSRHPASGRRHLAPTERHLAPTERHLAPTERHLAPTERHPVERSQECKTRWRQLVREAGIVPLSGTPGAAYLQRRGLPVELATGAGVKFGKRWFGSPAVMFPIRDLTGCVVAAQGRYIVAREPHALSAGPVKQGAFMTPGCWDGVVTLTEAPIDALSLLLLGRPAIATVGTSLQPWLAQACTGRVVLVATDADGPGDAAAARWSTLLAQHGATPRRLRPPGAKDWNDVLLKRGDADFPQRSTAQE